MICDTFRVRIRGYLCHLAVASVPKKSPPLLLPCLEPDRAEFPGDRTIAIRCGAIGAIPVRTTA